MLIQKFSFDFRDVYFDFDGLQFAFRVSTMEQFAGGQRRCPGQIIANLWRGSDGNLRLKIEARHQETIKAITLLIRGLAAPIDPSEEKIHSWPLHGGCSISDPFPFAEIKTLDGGTVAFMPTTTRLRFRRWSVYQEYSGHYIILLVWNVREGTRFAFLVGTD